VAGCHLLTLVAVLNGRPQLLLLRFRDFSSISLTSGLPRLGTLAVLCTSQLGLVKSDPYCSLGFQYCRVSFPES